MVIFWNSIVLLFSLVFFYLLVVVCLHKMVINYDWMNEWIENGMQQVSFKNDCTQKRLHNANKCRIQLLRHAIRKPYTNCMDFILNDKCSMRNIMKRIEKLLAFGMRVEVFISTIVDTHTQVMNIADITFDSTWKFHLL